MIALHKLIQSLVGYLTLYSGGSDGGATTSTVTNTQQLPAYAQPYAEQLMSRSAALSNRPYTNYPGQRIADLNANQTSGINATSNQAQNGFKGQQDALSQYQSTVRGDYLNPSSNPYLQSTVNKAMSDVTNAYRSGTKPQTDAAFARSGAFGGSSWRESVANNERQLADSLGNTAMQMYGNNYLQERGNQMNAMNNVGTFQNVGYTDASKLIGAGDIQRSYLQDLLNQAYGDWTAAQNQPYANLDVLAKGLSGSVGNSGQSFSSQSNPYQASPFSTYLGGGLAAAGLAKSLGLLGG